MAVGRRFYGVPYSSRWRNSHYPGFEISIETALNALNDPYSIAYDGGAESKNSDGTLNRYDSVSKKTEVGSRGGPGYGLSCSAFASLICGNPYPQTNRGFTFDTNFSVKPVSDVNSGMVMSNKRMSHCVFVDDIYDFGYALFEAVDPCVAKTVHTGRLAAPGYLGDKTKESTLNDYPYAIANIDASWYGGQLLNFDFGDLKNGDVRPWRGHKAVYGPWDKSDSGSGIGVTIHNNATTVRLIHVKSGTTHELNVTAGTLYLDISEYVTESGTYTVDSGEGTVQEKFRYRKHADVTLSFDDDGKAVFSHSDVEYCYVRVSGCGGDWGRYVDTSKDDPDGEPMVIAAGKYYPDLAADKSRIKNVFAAIVADPTTDAEGNPDCWGKYSCICTK